MDNSLKKKVDVTSEFYVNHGDLGGGFKPFLSIFIFTPYLGKWSKLTNIFQMGCNQLVIQCPFELNHHVPRAKHKKGTFFSPSTKRGSFLLQP